MGRGGGEASGRGGEESERNEWEKICCLDFGGFGRGRLDEGEGEEEDVRGGEFEEGNWRWCCWSCMTVLTTQMGFVAAAVATPFERQANKVSERAVDLPKGAADSPAVAAAARWTGVFSMPWLNHSAYTCFPLPYTKKLMDLFSMREEGRSALAFASSAQAKVAYRPGTTPARVGPRPLKRAVGPSYL